MRFDTRYPPEDVEWAWHTVAMRVGYEEAVRLVTPVSMILHDLVSENGDSDDAWRLVMPSPFGPEDMLWWKAACFREFTRRQSAGMRRNDGR